jgi:hypothetical protein
MGRLLVALLAGALVVGAASRGEAQVDRGPTYQDTTGLTWSVATLELGLVVAVLAIVASDRQDAGTVTGLMFLAALVASGVTAGVAQALDAPVEPPMVFHQGIVGAALLGGLLSFSMRAAGERGDAPQILGVTGLLLGGAGSVTYSVLRMGRLADDPQLVEEAHFLSWGPVLAAGITTAVLGALDLEDLAPVIGASAGLVTLGIAMALVEVAIAEHPAPTEDLGRTTWPLFAYGDSF